MTRAFRRLLRIVFGFDKWHISSIDQRKYAVDIILYCNKKKQRKSFVEIGCGLGDILRNVQFNAKLGLDSDKSVLRASSFLSRIKGQKIQFSEFHFPDSPLTGHFDVITMVNWIHHIEADILKSKLSEYFHEHLDPEGEILIDTVQDPEYRHNHDIKFLIKDLNCKVVRLGEYARQREVWAIKK